ncbi:MAG: lysophospholipid acyltransferase family protein [Planctomycetota bacterium]
MSKEKITDPLAPIRFSNTLFYHSQLMVFGFLLKSICRLKVHGALPPDKEALIIASNHASLIDPIVLQVAVRRRLVYLMTSDYYFLPFLNTYSRIMRCIPVMEGRFNRQALRSALRVLRHGLPLGIFPQGGLRPENDFEAGMRGISLLISQSRTRVLPVRISGTHEAFPRTARMIRPARIEVRIGRPIQTDELADPGASPTRRSHMESLTQAVMNAIREL